VLPHIFYYKTTPRIFLSSLSGFLSCLFVDFTHGGDGGAPSPGGFDHDASSPSHSGGDGGGGTPRRGHPGGGGSQWRLLLCGIVGTASAKSPPPTTASPPPTAPHALPLLLDLNVAIFSF